MENKLLALLGICRKAGKLAYGFDAVREAIGKGAPLVIIASDISKKTKKEMLFWANKTNTGVLKTTATMAMIEQKIGKRAGVLAILDAGLANAVKETASRAAKEDK